MTWLGLIQANRFLDFGVLAEDLLTVTDTGHYYQPFRVDYAAGVTERTGKSVTVTLLKSKREKLKPGNTLEILGGRGALYKQWFAVKDKHIDLSTTTFRSVYLGIFIFIITFLLYGYIRTNSFKKNKNNYIALVISVCCSFAFLYIF